MSLYLNFRSQPVGGTAVAPNVFRGDGNATPLALRLLQDSEARSIAAGKNVVFAVHGFNVSYERGARALGRLESQLRLAMSDLYLGVLWPGDYWLPVVNYPFEGGVAIECGNRLAQFCRQTFATAQSFSFISHSLGARLVLEAVKGLDRPARVVCLAAAAINQDCLTTEYSAAAANSSAISLLASRKDLVLKYAFQIGDPIADALHDDHTAFELALGYGGPSLPAPSPVGTPWQIPESYDYGHGDYLPPGDAVPNTRPAAQTKWSRAAEFMARALHGQPQAWP